MEITQAAYDYVKVLKKNTPKTPPKLVLETTKNIEYL